jgi:hypothetical protein
MLKTHFDAVERAILVTSEIPANAGHPLNRGTPRATFIRKFLGQHISNRVSIGCGEIIDAFSVPGDKRNQIDIVIFRNDYPRIHLSDDIQAFLAESVVATIEVKSVLQEADLETAILSARNSKSLHRHMRTSFTAGYVPPGILSYVVSYAGPTSIETVYGWLKGIEDRHGLNAANLPARGLERLQLVSQSIDGIFCLGLGTVMFDNSPMNFVNDYQRVERPENKYSVLSQSDGNLLLLFLVITQAVSGTSAQMPQLAQYLTGQRFQGDFRP